MVRRTSLGLFGVCVWTLCVLSAPSLSTQSSLVVQWTGERLTVSANNIPLAEVLREVARQTGVQFIGTERLTESVSIEFKDRSLGDGLRLLLAQVDYLMALPHPTAPPSAPLARIFLFRPGESRSVMSEPTATGQIVSNEPEPVLSAETTIESPAGVTPVLGEPTEEARDPDLQLLEDSGFFEHANASALIDAVNHPNPAVRIKALEVLSQRNPSLSADVLGSAVTDADAAVSSAAAALMAENADARAVESLGELLKHDDPVVRFGAIQLLAQRGDVASLPYVRQVTHDENLAVRTVAEQLVELLEGMQSRQ